MALHGANLLQKVVSLCQDQKSTGFLEGKEEMIAPLNWKTNSLFLLSEDQDMMLESQHFPAIKKAQRA